jgi:membrane-bound lytic murein transglycosylase F
VFTLYRTIKIIFLPFLLLLLTYFLYVNNGEFYQTALSKIKVKKRLDVIILNAPTVYYIGDVNEKGFEYDLLKAYAKSIDVDLNLTVVYTVQEALELTRKGVGDITAASLSVNTEREKEFKFGPYYHSIYEELICHNSLYKKGKIPKNIKDLVGLSVMVGKNTSAEATLLLLKRKVKGFDFNTTTTLSTGELLEKVWMKKIDCTVADSHMFMVTQRYYPELVRTLRLTDKINLGWLLRQGDNSLRDSLFLWLNKYERSGKLEELNQFYYKFLDVFDYVDNRVFHEKIKDVLPKYEKYFKEAGEAYGIPWMLLAAQSYQESHWKPEAKSHTGVRGMMMLTRDTAKLLKVKNRLNVKESIHGGAKYFDMIKKLLPKEVSDKNRLALSLAAYNIGLGHIYDAQGLAQKLNKDPYSWSDLKTVLPLLSQKKYYKNLKYGYARGNEPVRYVDAIQNYYDIIVQSRVLQKENRPKTKRDTNITNEQNVSIFITIDAD